MVTMLEWSREVRCVSVMGAAKAKAHFLSVVDEVASKREPVTITKKGRPLVQIVPMPEGQQEDPLAMYKFGGGAVLGDLLSPANDPEDWKYD